MRGPELFSTTNSTLLRWDFVRITALLSPEDVHLVFEGLGLVRQAGQLFVSFLQLSDLALQYLSPHSHVIPAVLQPEIHMMAEQWFV